MPSACVLSLHRLHTRRGADRVIARKIEGAGERRDLTDFGALSERSGALYLSKAFVDVSRARLVGIEKTGVDRPCACGRALKASGISRRNVGAASSAIISSKYV
jgi:hypothetical protein